MALADNELAGSTPFPARAAMVVDRNKVGTIEAQDDVATLPVGTPLAWNTSTASWTAFTQGGSNGSNVIAGFVAHDEVTVDDTDDVQVVVMLEGQVHRDHINTAAIRAALLLASGAAVSEAQLDTALKASTLRDKGLYVQGLAEVAG
jgi:hypothetical protein